MQTIEDLARRRARLRDNIYRGVAQAPTRATRYDLHLPVDLSEGDSASDSDVDGEEANVRRGDSSSSGRESSDSKSGVS